MSRQRTSRWVPFIDGALYGAFDPKPSSNPDKHRVSKVRRALVHSHGAEEEEAGFHMKKV